MDNISALIIYIKGSHDPLHTENTVSLIRNYVIKIKWPGDFSIGAYGGKNFDRLFFDEGRRYRVLTSRYGYKLT